MGRTHMASGLLGWVLLAPAVASTPAEIAVGAGVAALAALGPDLDHTEAKAGRMLGPLRYPVTRLVAWLSGGHRKGTHTVWAVLIVCGIASIWCPPWAVAAIGIGWAAHIVGDCLTVGGVPVLYPVSKRELRGPFTTGHWSEMIFAFAQTCAIVWFVWTGYLQ